MVDAGLRLISIMFQFHKGTIKPVVCKELQMVLQCFNSIKVRLNLEKLLSITQRAGVSIP